MNEEPDEKNMTIGQLAKQSGVGVETIRFYQRKGLLEKPRPISGFRKYSDFEVKKIKFIKKSQCLGFSLENIKDLLRISDCTYENSFLIREACQKKILEIDEKINDLKEMKKSLVNFSESCGNKKDHAPKCGLLSCFEKKWQCCQDQFQ